MYRLGRSKRYDAVPAIVIDAKLRGEGTLHELFPDIESLDASLTEFGAVIAISDIAEVIRKLSAKGIAKIGQLLERTVEQARNEFELDDDELRRLMSALILLWWRAYHQKTRAEVLRARAMNVPACHSCGDWGRAIVFKVDGAYATLAAMTARHGTEALVTIAGRPDVEVVRVACSCKFGQELYKRNVPIL